MKIKKHKAILSNDIEIETLAKPGCSGSWTCASCYFNIDGECYVEDTDLRCPEGDKVWKQIEQHKSSNETIRKNILNLSFQFHELPSKGCGRCILSDEYGIPDCEKLNIKCNGNGFYTLETDRPSTLSDNTFNIKGD